MQDKLRRRYQIHKEVSRGCSYGGKIRVRDLTRLAEFLYSDDATIEVEFEFIRSEYDAPMVKGRLDTSLLVECQRCLKVMEKPLAIDFSLLVDAVDELVTESSLDTIYSQDGYVDIFEVAEDELILGLPLVNMHDDVACNKYWSAQEQEPEATLENPFSVLDKLKIN
ncbi:MAG: YceD family protein [Gammaproteobacteria bacterium]|nr:YceD family protein [Gammaproteobacteria bacterium]MCZ6579348.1 YceD family protein [Gammaproteobacteria bacterium]